MEKKAQSRLNNYIKAREVRLIDAEGQQIGIVPLKEALQRAGDSSLDLVEVSAPGAEVPVCRIMDYGKFKFEQRKQKKAAKKRQRVVQVKEVKLRPGTEANDYQVKLSRAIRFLEQGDKVKVSLRFRGREMVHQELGYELVKRFESDLEEYAAVEQSPQMEGRQLVMVVAPHSKKK